MDSSQTKEERVFEPKMEGSKNRRATNYKVKIIFTILAIILVIAYVRNNMKMFNKWGGATKSKKINTAKDRLHRGSSNKPAGGPRQSFNSDSMSNVNGLGKTLDDGFIKKETFKNKLLDINDDDYDDRHDDEDDDDDDTQAAADSHAAADDHMTESEEKQESKQEMNITQQPVQDQTNKINTTDNGEKTVKNASTNVLDTSRENATKGNETNTAGKTAKDVSAVKPNETIKNSSPTLAEENTGKKYVVESTITHKRKITLKTVTGIIREILERLNISSINNTQLAINNTHKLSHSEVGNISKEIRQQNLSRTIAKAVITVLSRGGKTGRNYTLRNRLWKEYVNSTVEMQIPLKKGPEKGREVENNQHVYPSYNKLTDTQSKPMDKQRADHYITQSVYRNNLPKYNDTRVNGQSPRYSDEQRTSTNNELKQIRYPNENRTSSDRDILQPVSNGGESQQKGFVNDKPSQKNDERNLPKYKKNDERNLPKYSGDGLNQRLDKLPKYNGEGLNQRLGKLPKYSGDGLNQRLDKLPKYSGDGLNQRYRDKLPKYSGDGLNQRLDKLPNYSGDGLNQRLGKLPKYSGDGLNQRLDKLPKYSGDGLNQRLDKLPKYSGDGLNQRLDKLPKYSGDGLNQRDRDDRSGQGYRYQQKPYRNTGIPMKGTEEGYIPGNTKGDSLNQIVEKNVQDDQSMIKRSEIKKLESPFEDDRKQIKRSDVKKLETPFNDNKIQNIPMEYPHKRAIEEPANMGNNLLQESEK